MSIFATKCSVIKEKKVESSFGKYKFICKIGDYCTFGIDQLSNQLHTHSCYELCIIFSGTGTFIHNGISYDISSGDIIMADPYVPHEIQSNDYTGLNLLYLFIDIIDNVDLSPSSIEDNIIHSFIKNHAHLKKSEDKLLAYFIFLDKYTQHSHQFSYGIYQSMKTFIIECLACLSDISSHDNNVLINSNTLEKAQDYIDQNLYRRIYVEEIAKHCCISVRTLQYTFKHTLDITVIAYINQKKINLACHYLLSQFSIQDAANLIGIRDISQFNRLFKSITGFTPSQLQKLNTYNNTGFGRRLDNSKTTV